MKVNSTHKYKKSTEKRVKSKKNSQIAISSKINSSSSIIEETKTEKSQTHNFFASSASAGKKNPRIKVVLHENHKEQTSSTQFTFKKNKSKSNKFLTYPICKKSSQSVSKENTESVEYNKALENFTSNYENLISNLKHKKDFLNVFDEEPSILNYDELKHLPEEVKKQPHTSNKYIPKINMLDKSFEYSFLDKDFYKDFSSLFTPSIFKKYSILPKKEYCLPQSQIKLDDDIVYDLNFNRKKLLVIDLVDTLVRIKKESFNDSVVEDVMNELETNYSLIVGESELQIQLRPGLSNFLKKIKLYYHIIVFTSSSRKYAEPILNFIDPNNTIFNLRLYQSDCSRINTGNEVIFLKDLRLFEGIENFIGKVVCVDDDLMSFAYNMENGVPIVPFSQNCNCYSGDDEELWYLGKFLEELSEDEDVRKEIGHRRRVKFEEKMKKLTKFIDFL